LALFDCCFPFFFCIGTNLEIHKNLLFYSVKFFSKAWPFDCCFSGICENYKRGFLKIILFY
jgi:hypothetical protein